MWNNSDDSYNTWDTRRAVLDCVNRIKEIEEKGKYLTDKELKELHDLKDALHEYKKKCVHTWAKAALFQTVKKFCNLCGEEDKKYDYFSDKEYNRPKL